MSLQLKRREAEEVNWYQTTPQINYRSKRENLEESNYNLCVSRNMIAPSLSHVQIFLFYIDEEETNLLSRDQAIS